MTRTFLISGAAGGLGGCLVEAALQAGHNVLATDLAADAVPVPDGPHDRLRVRATDVTSSDAARDAVEYAVDEFGGLDVLVNCAGYRSAGSIEDMPEDEFRRNVEVNFFGAVTMVRAALPVLRPQRSGRIVNVSTIGGRRAQPGLAAYQASKWALGGFTEILDREVTPIGIRATLVEPGGIRTPWATAPLPFPTVRDEYDDTVGVFVRTYRDNPDVQRGDPARMARVILRITEEPEPPTRLLLGSDAAWLGPRIAEARAVEDAAWHDVSVSTDLDGLPDFADTPVAQMVRPPALAEPGHRDGGAGTRPRRIRPSDPPIGSASHVTQNSTRSAATKNYTRSAAAKNSTRSAAAKNSTRNEKGERP